MRNDNLLTSIPSMALESEVDVYTVLRWIEDGDCPPPKIIGGFARWNSRDLRQWADNGNPVSDPPDEGDVAKIRSAFMEDVSLDMNILKDARNFSFSKGKTK